MAIRVIANEFDIDFIAGGQNDDGEGRANESLLKSMSPSLRRRRRDRERQRHQWYAAVLCFPARVAFFLTSPGVRRELEQPGLQKRSLFSPVKALADLFHPLPSYIFWRRQTIANGRMSLARDGSPATVFGGRMGTSPPMSARRNANNTLSTLSRLNDNNDNKDGGDE